VRPAAGESLEPDVAAALRGRSGWRLEPAATPGAPPSWCFVASGRIELSVLAGDGLLALYVTADDQDVELESVDALVSWLRTNRPEAFGPRRDRVLDRIRRGRLFSWD
jgi:hypothetical protein